MAAAAENVRAGVDARFPGALAAAGSQPAGGPPADNEFVVFSKPELGRLGAADLEVVWDLFSSSFAAHGVTVHQAKILTGPELEAAGAMQQHYGVINQISRLGRPALTPAADQALTEAFGDSLDRATVLGGHQFLERFPTFSPYALAMLFSNLSVTRLGPGTYAAPAALDGETVIVLNGFHPRQLSFFTAEDAVCVFLHASATTAWEVLRGELIGATDPAKAAAGSIRGKLYADPTAFGLRSVNSNFNGVHMSAGPLEGLAELGRFFGDAPGGTHWSFAERLVAAGATAADVTELTQNPDLEVDGSSTTAFDATEGVDAAPAAELLVRARQSS